MGSKIDHGNRMLGMDLVPRDESGSPIDPKTAGVLHLYRAVRSHCVCVSIEPVGYDLL